MIQTLSFPLLAAYSQNQKTHLLSLSWLVCFVPRGIKQLQHLRSEKCPLKLSLKYFLPTSELFSPGFICRWLFRPSHSPLLLLLRRTSSLKFMVLCWCLSRLHSAATHCTCTWKDLPWLGKDILDHVSFASLLYLKIECNGFFCVATILEIWYFRTISSLMI